MTSNKAVRAALLGALAVTGLAACGAGSDGVASPGEGSFVPSPPPAAPPVSPPSVPPVLPPSGPAANCPTVAGNAQPFVNVGIVAGLRNCQLPALITGAFNVPKTAGVIYSVSSAADVGQDRGGDANAPLGGTTSGILSIDPGVVIFGSGGLDFIRVNRGSQIQASGTLADPIIFTSRGDIENTALADEAPGGQWGGLLILGRAPINDGCGGQNQQITAVGPPATNPIVCQTLAEATNAFYGGNSPTDNSGRLSFVVVKYPGFNVTPNKELNGITLSGVGNGTQVENVQVHQSSDDGIEIFGGTVNVKNAVLTGSDDDSFDTDLGWRGAAQYLLIVQRTTGGDRGFEWSAHESTVPANLDGAGQQIYRSQPRVSNATIVMRSNVGTPAILENLGTQGFIYNSVFTRQANTGQCLDIDNTYTLAVGGQTFQSVFLSCGATAFTVDGDVDAAAEFAKGGNGLNNTSNGVSTLTARTGASTSFVNGVNENAVVVQAPANSGAANGVVSTFLTTPGKIGAVFAGNDTWYQGWTCSPMIGEESC
ncbi:MAG TPA: hypothetical protein VGO52_18170 [Hyphomonadaceae bacterium]|nr:hypothetical protein [Hyphomonadaceae bacterium]